MNTAVTIVIIALCIHNICGNVVFPVDEEDYNRFDYELLKQVLINRRENVVISPFSAKVLLSLLGESAQDYTITQSEIKRNVVAGMSTYNVLDYFKSTTEAIKHTGKGFDLDFASLVLLDKSVEASEQFRNVAKLIYGSQVANVDFSKAKEAAKEINDWCSKMTRNNIKNLVSERDMDSVALVLLNALHFQADWKHKFLQGDSALSDFYVDDYTTVQATMMSQTKEFPLAYSRDLNASAIRLPYVNEDFAMTIILPDKGTHVDNLIWNLTPAKYSAIKRSLQLHEVSLVLPKFSFQYNTHLVEALQKLGIKKAFTNHAEFYKFTAKYPIKLSNVIQKSQITVDEDGTTASAVTYGSLSFHIMPETFHASRPFVFFIEHTKENVVLFAGKVVNPLSA